jgi:hypothetical protein
MWNQIIIIHIWLLHSVKAISGQQIPFTIKYDMKIIFTFTNKQYEKKPEKLNTMYIQTWLTS